MSLGFDIVNAFRDPLAFREIVIRAVGEADALTERDDIFGVTLKQHWNSSNYSDVGYLFLMINFEDEMNPTIQVRTWQPDKYNGKPLPREEVFSLDMFSI